MTNVTLHPTLAREIARLVTSRGLAGEMVQTMLLRKDCFNQEDFLFWRNQHIEASAALCKLGIMVSTYNTAPLKGAAS